MKKIIIPIILGIFLISLVSAELPIQEFFQDNVTNLTITIHQNESQANLYLNTAGTSFDTQNVSCNDIDITNICTLLETPNGELNLKISDFLNGINSSIKIENGFNYPQFDSLSFSNGLISISPSVSVSFTFLINRVFSEAGIPLNSSSGISAFNDYLAQHPLPVASDRNIIFNKTGTNYNLWNDKGYGDISPETLNQIRDIINESIISINIPDIVSTFLPIVQNSTFFQNHNLSFINNLDLNYTVGFINLSQVKLKDGKYNVTVFVERDNQTFYKNITLILEGIKNIEEVEVNDTYIPIIQEIKDLINKITGLGNNKIKIEIFDVFSSFPINTKVIKYFNITVENQTNATMEFKYDSANPERISLYILENEWVKLSTRFNGSVYEADIPHFSLFVIAEEIPQQTSSSSGGGGDRRNRTIPPINVTIPDYDVPLNETDETIPIDLTPKEPKKPDYSSLLLTGSFLLLLLVLYLIFKLKRGRGRPRKEPKKDLNSQENLKEYG